MKHLYEYLVTKSNIHSASKGYPFIIIKEERSIKKTILGKIDDFAKLRDLTPDLKEQLSDPFTHKNKLGLIRAYDDENKYMWHIAAVYYKGDDSKEAIEYVTTMDRKYDIIEVSFKSLDQMSAYIQKMKYMM